MTDLSKRFINARRDDLEKAALKFARMKKLGRYIDNNGSDVQVSGVDVSMYTEAFQRELCLAAVDLFAEIAASPLPERNPE